MASITPSVTAALGRIAKAAAPCDLAPGVPLELPGRGRTCVIDLPGPPGAPTLILVHALATTAALSWYPSMPALSERFRVIAFDQRWHGRGIRSEAFSLEDCADDVVAVADALGVEKFTVAGYSMGGAIAQLVWRRHRARLDGMVLAATARNFRGTAQERLWFGLTGVAMNRFATRARLGMERRSSRLADTPAALTADAAKVGPWAMAEFRSTSPWALFAAMDAIGRFDSAAWIKRVDVPVSVIVANRDRAIPTRRQHSLAAAIPGAISYEFDGSHAGLVLGAEEFVPVLLEACESISRRTRRTPAA
ncbi:MAG TPA: alpha/beta hydrolase [Mycobacteriales bacterium]|nr:alpha/beta hydrolase [Mycobacteriales bacterium]HVX69163.1 alpha/beta hydrolase [Mycobacteriales bacterium]